MKIIEQLELDIVFQNSGKRSACSPKAPSMMVDAKWWFQQIKKCINNAQDVVPAGDTIKKRTPRAR